MTVLHKDEPIVRELVSCIEANFEVAPGDIRCTSVRPYRLPVGQATSERLRDEVAEAEVVLGILTTDTLQSNYVAFELGAAWGQRVSTLQAMPNACNCWATCSAAPR